MYLLVWSIVISFGNMLSIQLIPKIVLWFLNNNEVNRKLMTEISSLKKEQSEISIVKEFSKHAKLQRRINKLNEELKHNLRESSSKNVKIKFIWKISLYIFSGILNFLFIYYNYHQTVLYELPSNWFSPLSSVVSWPSSRSDTMSLLLWHSITNYVAKMTTNHIF